jgi:4-amino-4-deoxy-L-arabinose transferase-like glycosyltransferase
MGNGISTTRGVLQGLDYGTWFALLALFAVIYAGSAFSPALLDDADSTHAEAAREMAVSGDYVTLHVHGVRYLEKAPLPYWLVALSYRLLGVNEFATRLPTVLAMLLLSVLGVQWAGRAFGGHSAIYGGLFVATAAGAFLFTRIMIPEALLSLLIAAALYFFFTALTGRGLAWRWYAGYALVGLGVLAKGLVALVFVGATAVLYLVVSGEWRRWREFRLFTGLLVLFAVAAPWHILAGIRNPRFFWFYFVNEHFLRFLGERYPKDYNKLPASLYWGLHLIWLFPWSFFLLLPLRRLWRVVKEARAAGEEVAVPGLAGRTRLLLWIWAGVVLVFFAFSTSQEYYTFPAYFPLLLLLADGLAEAESLRKARWLVPSAALLASISLIAGAVLLAGLWSSRQLPFEPDISTVLAAHNLAEDTLSMSHMLDLTGQSFAALRLPAILAALALVVGPVFALGLRMRRRHYAATWVTALTMGLFLVAAHIAFVRFGAYLSSKTLADRVAQVSTPSDLIVIYGDQAYGSSFPFYLQRPIYLVNGRTTSMWFGSSYPDAPHIFWDDAELLREWNSQRRIFLFVPPHLRSQVLALLPSEVVIAETSGKTIFSNRP